MRSSPRTSGSAAPRLVPPARSVSSSARTGPPPPEPRRAKEGTMTRRKHAELSPEELERETGEPLPDREAMSIVDLGEVTMTAAPVPVDHMPTDPEAGPPTDDQTYPVDRPWWNPPPPAS